MIATAAQGGTDMLGWMVMRGLAWAFGVKPNAAEDKADADGWHDAKELPAVSRQVRVEAEWFRPGAPVSVVSARWDGTIWRALDGSPLYGRVLRWRDPDQGERPS